MASSSLMASQTLFLRNPKFLSPQTPPLFSSSISLSSPKTHLSLSLSTPKKSRVFTTTSSSSSSNSIEPIPTESPLTDSTRTLASIIAITITISKILSQKLSNFTDRVKSICTTPTPDELLTIHTIQDTVLCTVGPLFFAKISARGMNTPLTVVVAGMGKWLKIYNGVLMIRVLLSWFPNIPWERQPFAAIKDLCDPYLNLFRSIIPPLFNALDVSPIFALTALGALAKICSVKG